MEIYRVEKTMIYSYYFMFNVFELFTRAILFLLSYFQLFFVSSQI